MSVRFARPSVGELIFTLFSRSVHPELFLGLVKGEIYQDVFAAEILICEAGHQVRFRAGKQTVTEVLSPKEQVLPTKCRLVRQQLFNQRDLFYEFDSGILYQSSSQLEWLEPEVFLNLHQELQNDCRRSHVSYQFPAVHRLSPGPLSYVHTEVTRNSLLVHAFHTFPDECAVVKSQSLFEC